MGKWGWILIILIVILLCGGLFYVLRTSKKSEERTPSNQGKTTSDQKWVEKGVAIAGQYADADAVAIGGGKYRLYYSAEPEASKNLEVYSATSTDGKTWTQEEGVRKTMAVFPDVLKLKDNQYRMYYQNAGEIKSAISSDGLTFQDEAGTRINKIETGLSNIESVGAQSTTQLEDGSYIMVYRVTISEPYQTTEKIPNTTTQFYYWATSQDGLTFEKKGLAIDSRNDTLYGLADGADWVNWDDGNLRLYFWSYRGVYHSVLENASTANHKFSEPVFDFTNNQDTNVKFAPNPPSDPTLINIGGKWFMYYGQHTKGIYYATLE